VTDGVMFVVALLADETPRDTGPDFGKASPFGLVIVVLLLIGTFLLVWSMNRHLRKLPKSFDRGDAEADQSLDEDPNREPGG
jgi:hypothetical protein